MVMDYFALNPAEKMNLYFTGFYYYFLFIYLFIFSQTLY